MTDKTTKSKMLNIRIDPETLGRLQKEAEKDDRTLSYMGLHFIKQGLKKQAKANAAK